MVVLLSHLARLDVPLVFLRSMSVIFPENLENIHWPVPDSVDWWCNTVVDHHVNDGYL